MELSNIMSDLNIALEDQNRPSSRRSSLRARPDNKLRRVKDKAISKPKSKYTTITIGSSEKEVKAYYTHNEKIKRASTNLETIFEEPKNQTNLIGVKKIRRSLKFTDGINVTKTTIQTRKKRVQKLFGKQKAKKISMQNFLQHLNTLHSEDNTNPNLKSEDNPNHKTDNVDVQEQKQET